MLEIKLPSDRLMSPMPAEHKDLMQQHLWDEKLPEAVLPYCPINKVLKGQKALVTGANSGIRKAVALSLAHFDEAGLGHVSEIAAAEAPHPPRGCPWQAWSVGELLRLDRVVLAAPDRKLKKSKREMQPA